MQGKNLKFFYKNVKKNMKKKDIKNLFLMELLIMTNGKINLLLKFVIF